MYAIRSYYEIINTISNNVANSQTPGYKSDTSVMNTFKKELLILAGDKKNQTGSIEYKYAEQSFTSLEQGTLEFSKSPFDIALQGNVYFNIQSEEGAGVLTRNGQFSLDGEGYLYLKGVGRVLGENGEIYIGTSDFSVSNSGEIAVNGQQVDTLALTYIPEDTNVNKIGDNTFSLIDGEAFEAPADIEFSVIQGAYERSNVDVAEEMTNAIAAQSSFQSVSQVIKMLDSINESAATQP